MRFLLFSKIWIFFVFITFLGSPSSAALIPYSTTAEEVLKQFNEIVSVTPARKATETDVKAFQEILGQIVQNPVGRFVLISIVNELESRKLLCAFPLEVRMSQEPAFFHPPKPFNHALRIDFCTEKTTSFVISGADQTKQDETPTDVSLFHEILHFARYLICALEGKREENQLSFYHPILKDHPTLKAWKDTIMGDYKTMSELKNNEAKRKERVRKTTGLKLKYRQCATAFPTLNCWKWAELSLIPLNQNCLNELSLENTPLQQDIVTLLKIPTIDAEEIRNIVGGEPDASSASPFKSHSSIQEIILHDICENGYRRCANLPLRYGHVDIPCKIDPSVVEWCRFRAEKCFEAVMQQGG